VLTDISGMAVDSGKPTKRFLRRLTLEGVENHLVRESFSAGSMASKVRTVYRFGRDGGW
jgi:carbamate kinase